MEISSLEHFKELEIQLADCLLKDRFRLRRRLSSLRDKWKNGQDIENRVFDLMQQIEESQAVYHARRENVPKIHYTMQLPILQKREEIIAAIRENPVVVIAGETGSGKTTQLPKMCLEAGRGIEGKIGCTQPRRIAATSIASHIAGELEDAPTKAVAHKIRFDSTDSANTYIKLMTDGILLAETQTDPFLNEYDTILIDEAHERALNIDFLLGYLKRLLRKRNDLKMIISSATIDTETFSEFFDGAPIIEVSGRMYPVEVLHVPVDKELEECGEVTMIDMAIRTTGQLMEEYCEEDKHGDILIFMPTEQDIRETVERLEKWSQRCVILPLFSRLTAADQNKVFRSYEKRKIIVSTNIAETSITIPGIRYVVDSGYARISRYCPRTRTQRLPIEPIAKSSAEQRKGRCGRVQDGICIRLYDEKDYDNREQYTVPEIRRCNLADVILRMLSLKLGDIEDFPFIDPPNRNAISDGFATLLELGAIDSNKCLTPLGRKMARLPIDPRTSRIILQAQKENALNEVLIIASVLNIQDPRERPLEKETEADRCHQLFVDERSDFITFLNLWKHYQQMHQEHKTQNKMRRFCRQHFLSYTRMREWWDIYTQLAGVLKERSILQGNGEEASYEAIHRSILSGYLSHICSKKENNIYIGRGDKELVIFPGSGQYNKQLPWIVAAEFVETSRLFARTVAKIDAEWIEPLAKHMCHYSYSNIRWDPRSQQVAADERVTLFGLVLIPARRVHYGGINRAESREIFLAALVQGEDVYATFDFLSANQQTIREVQEVENKMRSRTLLVEEDGLRQFYRERLPDVVSVRELKQFLRNNPNYSRKLLMTRIDVLRAAEPDLDTDEFPDYLYLGKQELPLRYHFEPGSEEDGITLTVAQNLLHQLEPEPFEWLVPALFQDKLLGLLKSLPKRIRKQFTPMSQRALEMYGDLPRSHNSLLKELEEYIAKRYNVDIRRSDWQLEKLDTHLQMRFQVVDNNDKTLAAGRDLLALQEQFRPRSDHRDWQAALDKWTMRNLRTWCFDTLPESVPISENKGGIPHLGYPGLQLLDEQVHRTLFRSLAEAQYQTKKATRFLFELSLSRDLPKLERILSIPSALRNSWHQAKLAQDLRRESLLCLRHALLDAPLIRNRQKFEQKLREIQQRIFDIVPEYVELLEQIERQRQEIRDLLKTRRGKLAEQAIKHLQQQLDHFFPPAILEKIPFARLKHYPRYLEAFKVRIDKACIALAKDQNNWSQIEPHLENWQALQHKSHPRQREEITQMIEEYRWMIEEYKVSIFAQTLGTAHPISAKRLDRHYEQTLAAIDKEELERMQRA